MVRLWGPLKAQTAHGHLAYPYPIDLYGVYPCFHSYGWVYEMRRTWHGMQATARRFVYPPNPNSAGQRAMRALFGQAVTAWQGLTATQKKYYNYLRYPPRMSGYNRFLRFYLRTQEVEEVRSYYEIFAEKVSDQIDLWRDLDISGDVPVGTHAVEVVIRNDDINTELWGGVRKKASGLDRRFLIHEAEGNGETGLTMTVEVDANRIIEVYSQDLELLKFTLIGYWL